MPTNKTDRPEKPGSSREERPPGNAGRYEALLEALDQGYCVVEILFDSQKHPVDYRFIEVNAAFERQTGLADVEGRTLRSLEPEPEEFHLDLYGRVALTGRMESFEKRIGDSGPTYDVRAFRLGDEAGRVIGILQHDISRRRDAEAELQHRMRNAFAIMRSIVRRTAASSETVEDCATHIESRLSAIARIESRAGYNARIGLDLGMIIADELAACAVHENGKLKLAGEAIGVNLRAAATVALAIQELATNAIKYGALAHAGGRIRVNWHVTDENLLRMEWKESGVTPSPRLERRGFGMDIFEKTLPYELRAKVHLLFEDDGVRCVMLLPLQHLVVAPMISA